MAKKKTKAKHQAKNQTDQPTLSLCMIVKDEAGFLRGCLASVKGLVDEIVVGDTGSLDETKEVASGAGGWLLMCLGKVILQPRAMPF